MIKHIKELALGVAALVALALGGATLAQGQAGSTPAQTPTATSPASEAGGTDTDAIQSGDQSAPEVPDGATEHPESAGENAGSEMPGNDGPSGHADEPGNPNADHQFQGKE